jgi:simple sugar transport system permease protein
MNIWLIFLIAAVVGTLLGMVNALVIYFFKIPPIITTIATQNIYYGVLTVLSQGKWLYGFPDWFKKFAELNLFTLPRGDGTSYGFSAIILIWLGLALMGWFILRFTILGRSIYAMGGNAASAQRAGFDLLKLNIFVYSFMGLMAGIASVIQALLVQTVAPNSLVGKELDTIAAVILGGASLMGGKGTVLGAMLGVALIAIMSNGITLMHVPASYYKVIIGLVILISVAASAYRQRAGTRKRVIMENN